MIYIYTKKNDVGDIYSFKVSGHAGYRKSGKDVICSAVSVLVINTINSIEKFTSCIPDVEIDDRDGLIVCSIDKIKNNIRIENVSLLINAMILGLKSISDEYENFVKIIEEDFR